jgi:hypothetical protein
MQVEWGRIELRFPRVTNDGGRVTKSSKFSAFAVSFGATASKRSEDGQVPKKFQVPSSKATLAFMRAIEAENAYAEKLTVMFSADVVYAQMNLIEIAVENGAEN